MKKETHYLYYWMNGGNKWKQKCFGKTDLFDCIRSMMKEGYTNFEIEPIKN